MKRQHPIKIVRLMSSYVWLLVIPLLRGLSSAKNPSSLKVWLSGAWLDIVVIGIIVAVAVIRWRAVTFLTEGGGIRYTSGVIAKKSGFVRAENISVAEGKKFFLLRPFGAVNVNISTDSGEKLLSLTMRYRDYAEVFSVLSKNKRRGIKTVYRPKKFYPVIFSVLFSSALSGAILIATFFIEAGSIVGEAAEKHFLSAVGEATEHIDSVVKGIPEIAVGIFLFLILGRAVSLFINLIRYTSFKTERVGKYISLRSGYLTKKHYYINSAMIFCAVLRQNIIMKLFGIFSVQVRCSGYTGSRAGIPVLIPITKRKDVISSMRIILPSYEISPPEIKPHPKALIRYIFLPVLLILFFAASGYLSIRLFPLWDRFIILAAVTTEIPTVIYLLSEIIAFVSSGISLSGGNVCIRYSIGTRFHTVIIPKKNIAKISVTQSLPNRRRGLCNVTFFAADKFISPHFVAGLRMNEVSEFLKKI